MMYSILFLVSGLSAPPVASVTIPTALVQPAKPDVHDRVLDQVAIDWDSLKDVSLDDNSYRDKRTFCRDAEEWLLEAGVKKQDRNKLAKALAKTLSKNKQAGYAWRIHELRARVLGPQPNRKSLDALCKAIDAYPDEPYSTPSKHSKFQHLINSRTLGTLELDGAQAAEEQFLASLQEDPRFMHVHANPLQDRYLELGLPSELLVLYSKAAVICKATKPEAAIALPDARIIDGDPKKLFVVLGDDSGKQEPRKLVVVMAGGSGQALDFLPWLTTICSPLYDRYCFVVLSAPQWNPQQAERFVWVTANVQKKYKAKFSVESFAREAVAQMRSSNPSLGDAFLFAWSSGGPATYRTILAKDNTFAGAYVLSSVFRPKELTLKHAKGKRFVLEQGRQDKVTPFRFAEAANTQLSESGAAVHFVPFDGGHGFSMPNSMQCLERALQFLARE